MWGTLDSTAHNNEGIITDDVRRVAGAGEPGVVPELAGGAPGPQRVLGEAARDGDQPGMGARRLRPDEARGRAPRAVHAG